MKKNLVLVGGGHAHMMVLERIHQFVEKGYGVTVIGPSDHHYYSGMGPGMLGGTYAPKQIRFATRDVVTRQGGEFVRGYAVRIDTDARQVLTRSGRAVPYDVVSCNAGSYIPMPGMDAPVSGSPVPGNLYPVKPIEKLMEASEKLSALFQEKSAQVNIVGGGPSSAEVAGNVWQLAKHSGAAMPDIRIFCRRRFMGRFSPAISGRVRRILEKRGIGIVENSPVQGVTESHITLASGERHATDFTFMAAGVVPSPLFTASGLPVGPDQGLLVNRFLRSVGDPRIFGGGDCIHFKEQPLDKVGVYAVRQNPVLLHNLMASLDGTDPIPFDPGPDYLLVFNLGGGMGVLKKKGLVFGGRLAFRIKDYIDTRFMTTFQAIEST